MVNIRVLLVIGCFLQLIFAQAKSPVTPGSAKIDKVLFVDSLHVSDLNNPALDSYQKADSGKRWCIIEVKLSGLDSIWVPTKEVTLIDADGKIYEVKGVSLSDNQYILLKTSTYLKQGGTLVFLISKNVKPVILEAAKFFNKVLIPDKSKKKAPIKKE